MKYKSLVPEEDVINDASLKPRFEIIYLDTTWGLLA
jgi:hypothetical protein